MIQDTVFFTPDIKRANYARIESIMAMENTDEKFIINEKTLRVEETLSANKSVYKLDLYQNQGSDGELEIKLNRNDLFFLTHMAVCIGREDPTNQAYANYPLYTFPDALVFDGDLSNSPALYDDLEAFCLEVVYNSLLTIKTVPVERIKNLWTGNFRYVPEQVSTASRLSQYGPSLEQKGFFPTQPNILLDGDDNNEIEIQLQLGGKSAIGGLIESDGTADTIQNKLVVLLQGYTVINGAKKVGQYQRYSAI